MKWKRMVYRGVDYGDYFMVSDLGHIKRLAYYYENGRISFIAQERTHKPKKRFNLVVKTQNIRKDIDVKRAVAENFIPRESHYHYVHKYDESRGNDVDNLYWSNEKKVKRDPATYNVFRERIKPFNKKIVKMYLDGATYKQIIEKYDVTRFYIRKVLDEHDIERPQMRNNRHTMTNKDLQEMKELFQSGASLSQVGDAFNISPSRASYYKKKLGLRKMGTVVPIKQYLKENGYI
jgi:DNA-binding CsgD family transcriptional regulator